MGSYLHPNMVKNANFRGLRRIWEFLPTLRGVIILPPRQPRFLARLPRWQLGLLACDCHGKIFFFVFTSECHVTCDLYFVTTKDNGDTREETKNDKRKSSGETVGVAFFQTKLNKWDKRFVTMRLSKTKDSFQGRLDSNVHQSIMSRMVKERIWNKPSYHRRPKPGICTSSINCLLIMIETTICTSQHKRKTSLCSKGSDNVK